MLLDAETGGVKLRVDEPAAAARFSLKPIKKIQSMKTGRTCAAETEQGHEGFKKIII